MHVLGCSFRQSLTDFDPIAETFLLLSQEVPAQTLGIIDKAAANLEVNVHKQTFDIQQSPALLCSGREAGTTGAVLWKITPMVANWLCCTDNFLWKHGWLKNNSTIMELGCGISGLVPLSMASLLADGLYILTDQQYMMKQLGKNVTANRHLNRRKTSHQGLDIHTMTFDWETDDVANVSRLLESKKRHLELILACDCVYNEYLIHPFVDVCHRLCALRRNASKQTGLLVCQQLRSQEVLQTWLEEMLKEFVVFRIPFENLPEDLQRGYVLHFAVLR